MSCDPQLLLRSSETDDEQIGASGGDSGEQLRFDLGALLEADVGRGGSDGRHGRPTFGDSGRCAVGDSGSRSEQEDLQRPTGCQRSIEERRNEIGSRYRFGKGTAQPTGRGRRSQREAATTGRPSATTNEAVA